MTLNCPTSRMSGFQDVIELVSSAQSSSSDEEALQVKPRVRHSTKQRLNRRRKIHEKSLKVHENDLETQQLVPSIQTERDERLKKTKGAPTSRYDAEMRAIVEGMNYHELQAQQQMLERLHGQNRRKEWVRNESEEANSVFAKSKARKVAPSARFSMKHIAETESKEWEKFIQKSAERQKVNRERKEISKKREVMHETMLNREINRRGGRECMANEGKRKEVVEQQAINLKKRMDRESSQQGIDAKSGVSSQDERVEGDESLEQINRLERTIKRSKVAFSKKRPRPDGLKTATKSDAQTLRRHPEAIETHSIKEKLSFTELQEQEKLMAFFRTQKRRTLYRKSSIGKPEENLNDGQDEVKICNKVETRRARMGVSTTTETADTACSLSFIAPPSQSEGFLASNMSCVAADCTAPPNYPVLHTTAWRRLVFEEAPSNLLQVSIMPYSTELDRPLWEYDKSGKMKMKCKLIDLNGQDDAMTHDQGKRQAKLNKQVRQLIQQELPQLEQCHVRRVRHIIHETRKQLATYFQCYQVLQSDSFRQLQWATIANKQSWTNLSPIERTRDQRAMQDSTHTVNPYNSLVGDVQYFVSRNALSVESVVYPETVTMIPHDITGLRRSFTMIGLRKNVFVEDDPLLRYVPYLGDGKQLVIDNDLYTATTMEKERLIAVFGEGNDLKRVKPSARDTEVHENLLRIVVGICGLSEPVILALEREAGFHQPRSDYYKLRDSDQMIQRTANRLAKVQELRTLARKVDARTKCIDVCQPLDRLAQRCWFLQKKDVQTPSLSIRLQPPLSVFESNYAQSLHALGLRDLKTYEDVAEWYRDLFCRRCFTYDCSEHGIQNPQRSIRADPVYPMVSRSHLQLTRQDISVQDSDEENTLSSTSPDHADSIDQSAFSSEDEIKTLASHSTAAYRRSRRTHTRISSLATNSFVTQEKLLESERLNELAKRRKRREEFARAMDQSEYLDNSYLPAVTSTMKKLLSKTLPCSSSCYVLLAKKKTKKKPSFNPVEIVLVRKLATLLGSNACVLAAILKSSTCSCAQIGTFMRHEKLQRNSGEFLDLENDFLPTKRYQKGRRQTFGVGYNRSLAKRVRDHQSYDREKKLSYKPCNHDGVCDDLCGCTQRGHACNRACSCPRECPNRFQGCKCSVSKCQTSACPCWSAGRECDPDYCFTCGASDAAVVAFHSDLKALRCEALVSCQNVNMLRGSIQKRVGVAFSATHGWGAYALEPIQKDDFVLEYTGELITDEEAERRGAIYDRKSVSYLFGVNSDYVVDAARKGNKAKFANHKAKKSANLDVRIIASNGEHRIGLFASEAIDVGAELFFDYGYTHEAAPRWSQQLQHKSEKPIYALEDEENEWEQWE